MFSVVKKRANASLFYLGITTTLACGPLFFACLSFLLLSDYFFGLDFVPTNRLNFFDHIHGALPFAYTAQIGLNDTGTITGSVLFS